MKKRIRMFPKLKKFKKEQNKKYIKKIRIYPSFLYSRLDKWLNKMSLLGWHIVDCGIFIYLFEKGEPSNKQYFTYDNDSPRNDSGRFSITMRHPFFEEKYGKNRKKSKLNANETKAHEILEIDLQKISIEKDIGLKELIEDRNRLYAKKMVRNVVIFLFVVLSLILTFILL